MQIGQTYRREATLDTRTAKGGTVELSFSSELPVERGGYFEVLDHSQGSVDLSRLSDGRHPLLLNHDKNQQCGVITEAWVGSDRRGRARVRFSKSQLGQEIAQDVADGIRRLVSVGYKVTKQLSREVVDGVETIRFAWQPYEISLTPVPADANCGVGRSATIERHSILMTQDTQNDAAEILAVASNLQGKLANGVDPVQMAHQAIQRGWSVSDFRAEMLKHLPSVRPMEKPLLHDVKPKEWARYSVTRAISACIEGRGVEGFEREMSDEFATRSGAKANGFWVPPEALTRNFVAGTGTLGGMVVETSNLGDQFVDLLRNAEQVRRLGARVIQCANPITIPRQSGAGAANWVAETTAATLSTGDFTQLTLTPHAVSAFQQYSRQLLMTSNPSIDLLVRQDITRIIALAIDLAAIAGTGSAQPTGILGTAGINTQVCYLTAGAMESPTLNSFLVTAETLLANDNADTGALGYLVHPDMRAAAKSIPAFASGESAVWEGGAEGKINGYLAVTSNQLAKNYTAGTATTIASAAIFGNWNDLILAEFANGGLDLVVDPYVLAVNGVVRIIARKWVDVGVRHPESFSANYYLA